jgi:DNA polymerase I-like protein with 3'-5' exonuclease and polymerase domains
MAGEDFQALLARLGEKPSPRPPEVGPDHPAAASLGDVPETPADVPQISQELVQASLLELTPPESKPRKHKGSSKPPPVVTPSPFRDLPAPEPVVVSMLQSLSDLQDLVELWKANPPELVGMDIETTGLSPLLGARIRTIQLQADGEPTCWVADLFQLGGRWPEILAPLFCSPQTTWVAHNAAFEVEHLAAAGIRFLSPVRCTLAAADLLSRGIKPTHLRRSAKGSGLDLASCCGRLLHLDVDKAQQTSDWGAEELTQEQLAYAALDARLALDLWKVQLPRLERDGLVEAHRLESQALPAVAEARLTGLRLDLPKARELLTRGQEELEKLASRLSSELAVENANSSRQVATAVEARGHQLPTTASGLKSTAEQTLRPIYQQDPGLDPLKDHRAVQKNVRTYLRNWVELAAADPEQRVRPQLNSMGAVTGRMSCPKGALPKPSTLHGVPAESDLRSLFVAAPGHLLVDGDWAAIEHRLAAAIYGEEAYVAIYQSEDPDPHSHTASAIYGRPISKADQEERKVGKTANFCLQYGGGPRRLREQLSQAFGREVPLEEARQVCAGWDRAYPAIAKVRDRFRQSEPWEVSSPLGRRMAGVRLTPGEPGVRFSGATRARLKSTAALAFPIQAAGAELLKETLLLLMPRLWKDLPGVRLCHLVHDEIVLEAPEELAPAAADLLLEVMQDPDLQTRYLRDVLPLVADVRMGRTWADTH